MYRSNMKHLSVVIALPYYEVLVGPLVHCYSNMTVGLWVESKSTVLDRMLEHCNVVIFSDWSPLIKQYTANITCVFLEGISAVRYDFLAVNSASNSMNYDELLRELKMEIKDEISVFKS